LNRPEERTGDFELNAKEELLDQVRVMISTPCLLKNYAKADKNIHTDGAYKLEWKGHNVLVVGTSDFDRKFHPLGLAVTTRETHLDYKFLFNCLDKGLDKMEIPRPTCIIEYFSNYKVANILYLLSTMVFFRE
jgi:diphthamide synthase subunit DPH2